jgi:hypothetical protein
LKDLFKIWKREESKLWQWQFDSELLTMDRFLETHGLSTVSLTTVWKWMRDLGFSYDLRKKSYYVDGHERSDVVEYRHSFCTDYLTVYEPRCLRWVQVRKDKAMTMDGVTVELGYDYVDPKTGKEMVEFHIDYCHGIAGLKDEEPQMSVRALPESKPLMILGQDECVFNQFLLGQRTWVGPNGERPLLPKTEGEGYMLSAFVSRELGFGRPLSEKELAAINLAREGQKYHDEKAALEINKKLEKPALTETPFVDYLHIGMHNEGYWTGFHMALQFEDVVDCLKVICPGFEYLFLFDHSQGHARKRDGALDANKMSKSFGGSQPKMRDTQIKAVEGFLGPHTRCLEVGDVQSMVFKPTDSGPWYLTAEEKEARRHDKPTGRSKTIERTKQELVDALEAADVPLQRKTHHSKKELQQFATNNGVSIHVNKDDIIQGWEGKPKGLLQVLWERGFLDENKPVNCYTVDGRKSPSTGEIDNTCSLRHMIRGCPDFKEEETALEHLAAQQGTTVRLTPKFHAELAGEGIEYSWAHAKGHYRRSPLALKKKGRESFKQLVKESTSPVEQLQEDRIRRFAARARAYICTYYYLGKKTAAGASGGTNNSLVTEEPQLVTKEQQLLFSEIERLMKDFKVHRCALDFDRGFVNAELKRAADNQR